MKTSEPKFKKGDEVVYHEGNWKLIVKEIFWDKDGCPVYHCSCNEPDYICEICEMDYEHMNVYTQDELISYDEWCDHGDECKKCHN